MLDRVSGEVRQIRLGAGSRPGKVVLNSTTNKIYVAHGLAPNSGVGFTNISVIDGLTLEAHNIETGILPAGIAVDERSDRVYVANEGDTITRSNILTVIDGATEATTDVIVGNSPYDVAVDPVTGRVVVANGGGLDGSPASVSIVDGSTLGVRSVPVNRDLATLVAINPTTGKAYIGTSTGASVLEIDEATLSVTTIPVGSAVTRLAVNPIANLIYATHAGVSPNTGHTVTAIDGATHAITEIQVGAGPVGVEVDSAADTTWVADSVDNTVTVLYGKSAICFRCPGITPFPPSLP